MSVEEFIEQVAEIAAIEDMTGAERKQLRALYDKLRDDLAFELAQWVDKHGKKAVNPSDQKAPSISKPT